jgi:hypothetical protein
MFGEGRGCCGGCWWSTRGLTTAVGENSRVEEKKEAESALCFWGVPLPLPGVGEVYPPRAAAAISASRRRSLAALMRAGSQMNFDRRRRATMAASAMKKKRTPP